jgi:hypothetical protein
MSEYVWSKRDRLLRYNGLNAPHGQRFFGDTLPYAMICVRGKEMTAQIRVATGLLTFLLPFRRNFLTR